MAVYWKARRMAVRGVSITAAFLSVALFFGSCFPDSLSDAERVWCDGRAATVIAAADSLNIGPEPKGTVDGLDTLAQRSYWKASLDRDWVRACKAAYEGR